MTITWLGHSCFHISSGDSSLVLDPYKKGQVPGLGPLHVQADAVYCTHEHGDHAARDQVSLSGKPCRLTVESIDCFHDDKGGKLRGKNKIYIISDGLIRLAHAGDLGHIPESAALEKLQNLDALLIPVGGHYTIGPETADEICRLLNPRVVIPMHYKLGSMGFSVLAPLQSFTDLRSDVIYYRENSLELTPETARQTAILSYIP